MVRGKGGVGKGLARGILSDLTKLSCIELRMSRCQMAN